MAFQWWSEAHEVLVATKMKREQIRDAVYPFPNKLAWLLIDYGLLHRFLKH